MPPLTNRLDAPWLDAALHLLDRQVVDVDGKMVCNVDDLELIEGAGGEMAVTGILVGAAALVPRFSGRLGSWLRATWISLGVQYAARDVPLYLPLDLVEHVGSDVRIRVPREGLLDRQPASGPGTAQHRMDDLLGMDVVRDGERLGHVLDVRLQPRKQESRMLVVSLVVGRGRPGSLLGYDRGDFNGPALVKWAVTSLHRHSHLVPIESVRSVDWDAGRVEVSGPVEPLRTS
jgi:sporulation protein YlmC with PRC-barrel domain